MYIYTSSFATIVAVLVCFLNILSATASHISRDPSGVARSITTVYQFPSPTWLENLAIRLNGETLVTVVNPADLYIVDPRRTPATATLLYSFPDANAASGITEITPEVFVVAAGNYSLATLAATPGSWSV